MTTISSIMEKVGVEAFCHGNLHRADADATKDLLLKLMNDSGGGGLPKKKRANISVLKAPLTDTYNVVTVPSRDPSDPNTGVEVYIQICSDNIHDRCMTDLITHILYEPLYDQLRSRDQVS